MARKNAMIMNFEQLANSLELTHYTPVYARAGREPAGSEGSSSLAFPQKRQRQMAEAASGNGTISGGTTEPCNAILPDMEARLRH